MKTGEYEYGPGVTADGRYLLFTSHRDGTARLYRVDLQFVRSNLPARCQEAAARLHR